MLVVVWSSSLILKFTKIIFIIVIGIYHIKISTICMLLYLAIIIINKIIFFIHIFGGICIFPTFFIVVNIVIIKMIFASKIFNRLLLLLLILKLRLFLVVNIYIREILNNIRILTIIIINIIILKVNLIFILSIMAGVIYKWKNILLLLLLLLMLHLLLLELPLKLFFLLLNF